MKIEKIAVIGAGVMGTRIAALIANASYKVVLLDVAATGIDRQQIVKEAISKLLNNKPEAFTHPARAENITIGNIEDDLKLLQGCDLIIEAIVENLSIKQHLYEKIIPFLSPHTIISSNTSTYLLKHLTAKLSTSKYYNTTTQNSSLIVEDQNQKLLKWHKRFVIIHFFNPPRFMELVEFITTDRPNPQVVQAVQEFITNGLGKVLLNCSDTPGFIANRVGCFLLEMVVRRALIQRLDFVKIDQIFTKLFFLPETGIFGLYDLIGHDVMQMISTSVLNSLKPNDLYNEIYIPIKVLNDMQHNHLIGNKKGAGFYKLSNDNNGVQKKMALDLKNFSYETINVLDNEIAFKSIAELLTSNEKYGDFFREVIKLFYSYLNHLIEKKVGDFNSIDQAMKLGYNWRYGPFELAHKLGAEFQRLLPQNLLVLWQKEQKSSLGIETNYAKINVERHKIILQNEDAILGLYAHKNSDDYLVFSINTKVGCLTPQVFNLLAQSISYAEERKNSLFIYNFFSPYFSAGGDLTLINSYITSKNYKVLEEYLKLGQQTMLKLKYSKVNVISCAAGFALGGGTEMLLHSDYLLLHTNLRAGLIELGAGISPGWGGVKEMFLRAGGDSNVLKNNLANIINKNKTSSADYFISSYNISQAQIIMNANDFLPAKISRSSLPLKAPKLQKQQTTITPFNLIEVFSGQKLDVKQLLAIKKLQMQIDKKTLSENELLDFEIELFITLAELH